MRKLWLALLLSVSAWAQTGQTGAMLGLNQTFTGTDAFAQGIFSGPVTFSALTGLIGSTNLVYVSDGTLGSNPCTGGGTGAFALRIASAWNCASGSGGFVGGTVDYWASWDGVTFTAYNPIGQGLFSSNIANQVQFWPFRLTYPFTFNVLSFACSTISGSSNLIGISINSSTAPYNRLAYWQFTLSSGCVSDADGGSTTYAFSSAVGGAVTLPPGYYYWSIAASTTVTIQTQGGIVFSQLEQQFAWNARNNFIRTGHASNAMSGGVMPATLGTLTAGWTAGANPTYLPAWIVEPN